MKKTTHLLPFFSCLALFSSVHASGFQTVEQSAVNLGRANADSGLAGDDLSALYYNPAGMMLLSAGTKLQLGGSIISASTDFKDEGSSLTLLTQSGAKSLGSAGGTLDSQKGFEALPFAYVVGDIAPNMKWGVGLNVPFGLSTEYNETWEGRYHAIDSSIMTIDINPSIAYRFNKTFSIGAGVSFQYVKSELSKAIYTGTPNDGKASVEADGWSVGFNFGAVFEPTDDTRIGISYRSAVKHDVEGERTLENLGSRSGKVDGSTEVELPQQIGLSVFHRISPSFELMASARWTGWSSFEELRLKFDDGTEDVTPENWEDTLTLALGANYHASQNITYRAGIAFDESPIPSSDYRTPRIPGNDRIWLSSGFSYKFDKSWAIDMGYTYVHIKDADINNRTGIAKSKQGIVVDNLIGQYENTHAHILSAQFRYDF